MNKLQGKPVSNSTPDFSKLQANLAATITNTTNDGVGGTTRGTGTGGGEPGSVRNLSGSGGSSSGDHRISRKTAQTYLSGLSKGYISNIDNIKLINNCLNTTSGQS